jgi:GTP cyclohydrolase IA
VKADVNGLGVQVRAILVKQGLEPPSSVAVLDLETRRELISDHFRRILDLLGLDRSDDSLNGTPDRVATMYLEEVFYGLDYANFPRCTTVQNLMKYDEMITTKCQVKSFCEHHFVPFTGTAHVAYIPSSHVLGLSKFNRIVDFFSRRPQIQERLTEQILCALKYILHTDDVAVVISATHMCVQLRGVQDQCSSTVTSKLSGRFRSVPEARSEFLALTRQT